MTKVENPFSSASVARRYAHGRRYYHDRALDLALANWRPAQMNQLNRALDVACGTGLSTRAVRDRTHEVIAFDVAPAMVARAPQLPRVHYLVATAEQIPLGDASVDLATVGAAFHWFDQPTVFAELARVVRPGGALVVYTDFFLGRIEGVPEFTNWFQKTYLARFPNPPRHGHFNPDAATTAGFAEVIARETEYPVPLTRQELVGYLLSQSNAGAAIEAGAITETQLANDVERDLARFFPDEGTTRIGYGIRTWTTTRMS